MRLRIVLSVLLIVVSELVVAQNAYDARIVEYTGLRYPCGAEGEPVLKIRNVGTEAMFTCVVETWKNGLMVNSFDWVLAVPALEGEARQPILPTVPALDAGDVLEFRIISVNDQPDEGSDGNSLTVDFGAAPSAAPGFLVNVVVSMSTDPDSLMWAITDADAQVVAQGGPYISAGTTEQWVELDPAVCYMVRFAENGSEPSGDGQMAISSNSQQVVDLLVGSADEPARAGLVTGMDLGYDERAAGSLQLAPNPASQSVGISVPLSSSAVLVRVLDAQGRQVIAHMGYATEGRMSLGIEGLRAGMYAVRVEINGSPYRARLIVE